MNAHEVIDRFGAQSPRTKTLTFIAVVGVIVAALLLVFYWGVRSGDGWTSSKYSRERDENLERIAKFEQNERQLAAENALLKKQNEALASAYKAADTQREREQAQKFTDLLTERNKRYDEIDLDTNFDSQLCGLCDDGKRSGIAPFSFCGRCKAVP